MTDTKPSMSADQSMQIIKEMINKARFNFSRASFYFILWGTLLIGAALFEFYMGHIVESQWAYVAWPVVGMMGGIASFVFGARSERKEALTHLDRVYAGIWITYFATLALFLIGSVSQHINPGSQVMVLTGFPTFLTGFVLRFRPLIIGGCGFWVLGFASLFILKDYGSLIFAVSIVQGYLIPGLLMRNIKRDHV